MCVYQYDLSKSFQISAAFRHTDTQQRNSGTNNAEHLRIYTIIHGFKGETAADIIIECMAQRKRLTWDCRPKRAQKCILIIIFRDEYFHTRSGKLITIIDTL